MSEADGPPPPGVSYRTLRELAQEAIFQDIVEGRLKPDERLVEAALVDRYGIGRSAIREALRALEGQGLVRSSSNRGSVVSSLSRDELEEIYEIRAELEGLAADLGTRRLTQGVVAALAATEAEMTASIDDPQEWLALNERFHLTLYEASGRPRLLTMIRDLMAPVEPYIRNFLKEPERLLQTHSDHKLILRAARVGDADACAEHVRRHLRTAGQIMAELMSDREAAAASGRGA